MSDTPPPPPPSSPQPPIPPEQLRAGAHWLTGDGADNDVVISSRVRIARNIDGFAFLSKADNDLRQQTLELCRDRLMHCGLGRRTLWLDVHKTPTLDRTLLVERHLMSKEHARGDAPRGLLVSLPDEHLSVMVNEEDHLRLQSLRAGLALSQAWAQVNDADDRLDGLIDFAFSPRFGYLTSCPTNVGCGVRMSVMLHLPALRLTNDIDKAKRAARDMNLTVRGFYGEGSEATGDLYQISNQTTLGKSEAALLNDIEADIVPDIVRAEREARRRIMDVRRRFMEDLCWRALGTLRAARLLAPEEALTMLSLARLGALLGILPNLSEATVNQLMLMVQPAHLQRITGQDMDQQRRREARADLVRARLAGAHG